MKLLNVRVTRRLDECDDIAVFELTDPDGGDLAAFTAGSHVDVHLPGGHIRQYSLCNAPSERHRYQLGVLRAPDSRGGSIAMHEQVQTGSLIRISEPRNLFALVPAGKSLLFAGGIGITPLLSMAEQLCATGTPYELHYSARSRSKAAFRARIAASPLAGHVCYHFDDGPDAKKLNLNALIGRPDQGTHIYICGPAGYIAWVQGFALAQGWPPEQIHIEHFGVAPVSAAAAPAQDSLVVRLQSTGKEFFIPADKSITDVLISAGVDIPVSCEQGICGTCVTRVLAGKPEHRDMFLTDAEHARNDQMTPCCSRCVEGPLVLDL
jgi:vanillate O-demethylase ferredoxin subunit